MRRLVSDLKSLDRRGCSDHSTIMVKGTIDARYLLKAKGYDLAKATERVGPVTVNRSWPNMDKRKASGNGAGLQPAVFLGLSRAWNEDDRIG
jgi:hypothetical protein